MRRLQMLNKGNETFTNVKQVTRRIQMLNKGNETYTNAKQR